jgi:hypothetical protein
MAWTIANHIDRGTTETLQNPLLSACGVAFMGFFAGGDLVYHFTNSWPSHSFISVAGDYFIVALFLGMALERAYFLSRAIRRLQNSGPPPSVS